MRRNAKNETQPNIGHRHRTAAGGAAAYAHHLGAQTAPTLKLTAPDKLPDVGQTFTVTAELTGNTGLAAVQLSLGYDDSVVECTGIENGALVAGMLAASNPYATRGGVGAILAAATTTASPCLPSASRRRATRS